MGAAARRLADHVVVTSDNPRSEEPDAIIAAIVAGAEAAAQAGARLDAGGRARPPRRDRARDRSCASDGDIVLIAGKGHEQGQEFEGGRKVPFDDREVAREALRALAPLAHGVIELTRRPRSRAPAAPAWSSGDARAAGRGRRARAGGRSTRARVGPGDLFFGLAGEHADGGEFAAAAIEAGAWGVVVTRRTPRRGARRRRGRAGLRRRRTRSRRSARLARALARPRCARAAAASSGSRARPARPPPRTSCSRCSGRRSAGACTPTARTGTPRSACR